MNGKDLLKARAPNSLNAPAGRVAGVRISQLLLDAEAIARGSIPGLLLRTPATTLFTGPAGVYPKLSVTP